MNNKLLVICGPTATGKTELGILLAKKYNGEIISADSRQVYRGLDIVSGKDIPQSSKLENKNSKLSITNRDLSVGFREKDGVPIWLVDIIDPDYHFNVGEYLQIAQRVLSDIWSRGKLPIVVGGTGYYIKSIVNPAESMMIPPDKRVRNIMAKYTVEEFQEKLKEVDIDKWNSMNDSDRGNPRRLIRAIEVAIIRKNRPELVRVLNLPKIESFLLLGLRAPFPILYERIDKRVKKRIEKGAVEEIKNLMGQYNNWGLPAFSTAGCRELKSYFEGRESLVDATKSWQFKEHQYAKQQIAWFTQEKRIQWFDVTSENYPAIIVENVSKWYTST
ncbi:tRNA dimethylallyltransferase [Candidatus Gottesmanbacteria bacterium]|nr:tRNA dimethylallyltransferase [Candidatus Gottesmanbacteria bacterium]